MKVIIIKWQENLLATQNSQLSPHRPSYAFQVLKHEFASLASQRGDA